MLPDEFGGAVGRLRARASADSACSVASFAACRATTDARHRLDQFRPRFQYRVEARLVEAIAEHLVLGDDRRAARLAGQQSHLAEVGWRVERREPVARAGAAGAVIEHADRPWARM